MASEIKLDSSAVESIVAKAVMETISEEHRDDLIKQALQFLVAPRPGVPGSYYRNQETTPLQEAFRDASVAAANTAVKQLLTDDEIFQAKVDEAVLKYVREMMDDGSLYTHVGTAVGLQIGELLRQRASEY